VSARTEIAASERGPLAPLPRALLEDGRLRDALARAIPVPSIHGLGHVRFATALLGAFPLAWVMLEDLRGLLRGEVGAGRLASDALLVAFAAQELAQRTPRRPRLAALALLAIGGRGALAIGRVCARGVPAPVWLATSLAAFAGALWLARAPTASRVAIELAGKLGLSRADLDRARPEEDADVPSRLLAAAIASAVALPATLWFARSSGLGLLPQAALLVAYATVVPAAVTRAEGRAPGAARARARPRPAAIGLALLVGLAAATALVTGGEAFMQSGTELARCAGKLDAEGRRLVASQARDIASALARVRAETPLALLATLAVPLAEERVYRGLLLPVLVRRYGRPYALFATSLVFALAHAGVYETAALQTALLGFAFGIAYLEGGLVAAFATHAIWSLLQLA
jgi:membrane protease YdiL (CAAX protease family)